MKKETVTKKRFKPSKELSGILLMILHAISMSVLYIAGKGFMQTHHPNQVAFLYKFAILLAILPWCMKGGFKKNLRTKKLGTHIVRGTFSLMGTLCFFYGLSKIGVSDVTAMTYIEQIIVLLIGVFYFKEEFTSSKFILVVLSFVGVLFVTKPLIKEFNMNYIFIFLALIFWAVNNFAIKVLGKTEHTKAQLFYVMLVSSILAFPLALKHWKPIKIEHTKYILILALCYVIHVVAFFKAFKFTDISTVMPYDYSRLVFTGCLGYLFLGETTDYYKILGYAMIVLGGLYFIHSEGKKKGFRRKEEKNQIKKIEALNS